MTDKEVLEAEKTSTALIVNTSDLNQESLTILNQLIAEQDIAKQKDLTALFNQNQNKKTMVRTAKLNDLLDVLTDKFMERAAKCSDEITTAEYIQSLKTINDMIDKNQKMINTGTETPFIQINSQDNSVNVSNDKPLSNYSKESRNKVKEAVMSMLGNLIANQQTNTDDIIEAEPIKQEEEIK